MPPKAQLPLGSPKPKNATQETPTPHDAQAPRKKVWWYHLPPKIPHNETPLSPKDEQQANPKPYRKEKA